MKKPKPGPAGTHAFYGAYAPNEDCNQIKNKKNIPKRSLFSITCLTFSVGCFEWVPASNGGTKRGPVKVRVTGWTDEPEFVYNCAADVCKKLDTGTYHGAKTINFAL